MNLFENSQFDEVALSSEVKLDRWRVFRERLVASVYVAPLGILLCSWIIFQAQGWNAALTWAGLMLGVELFTLWVGRFHRLATVQGTDIARLTHALTACAGLLGLGWGSSLWFVWSEAHFMHYLAMVCILAYPQH